MLEQPSALSVALLLGHAAATLYLVGLAWCVQVVHYPLFAGVGAREFPAYERAHVARITPVVAPAMLAELATALALVALPPPHVAPGLLWLSLALVAGIWLSTFLLQVPRHGELDAGFDAEAHRRLVSSNWLRTALWTVRGGLVLWLVFRAAVEPVS